MIVETDTGLGFYRSSYTKLKNKTFSNAGKMQYCHPGKLNLLQLWPKLLSGLRGLPYIFLFNRLIGINFSLMDTSARKKPTFLLIKPRYYKFWIKKLKNDFPASASVSMTMFVHIFRLWHDNKFQYKQYQTFGILRCYSWMDYAVQWRKSLLKKLNFFFSLCFLVMLSVPPPALLTWSVPIYSRPCFR